MRYVLAMIAIVVSAAAAPARGHFVWIDVEPPAAAAPDDTPQPHGAARVWFSEDGEPGDAALIDKIAHTRLWLRTAGDTRPLQAQPTKTDAWGALEAAVPAAGAYAVDAHCDYGVVAKGPTPFLLHYYAKHLNVHSAAEMASLARAEALALDIVPSTRKGDMQLLVLWQGQPATDAAVLVIRPDGERDELKTNPQGLVRVPGATAGKYAIRANVAHDEAGVRDGKPFAQIKHYSTLVMNVPPESSDAAAEAPADPAAVAMLARARKNRAVWDDFPGFTCEVTVHSDGKVDRGTLLVSENGECELRLPGAQSRPWADRVLKSMIQHRMPDDPSTEIVRFADDELDHPLGRLVILGDGALDSVYRIRDDVVTEVNRRMGPGRFTISVLEVERNAEEKYLPRVFSVTFWNADGHVRSSTTSFHTWGRQGRFDLPERILEVSIGKDERSVQQIDFGNYKLLDPDARAAR